MPGFIISFSCSARGVVYDLTITVAKSIPLSFLTSNSEKEQSTENYSATIHNDSDTLIKKYSQSNTSFLQKMWIGSG
jgi:hypothetical protein